MDNEQYARDTAGDGLGDGLMKTTKIITETKEVHVCDFCENGEHMACNPATCVVCGKEACCDCTHKRLVGMEIKRPHYWATGGSCPHPETLWACPDCNDELTRKIVALNKTVELAQKYMGDFVRSYCNTLDAIMREANRREKRREANAKP